MIGRRRSGLAVRTPTSRTRCPKTSCNRILRKSCGLLRSRLGASSMGRSGIKTPSGELDATIISWGKDETVYRVHPNVYGSVQFNPSSAGNARFSPLVTEAGGVIPTLYAGTTLDCALMETV